MTTLTRPNATNPAEPGPAGVLFESVCWDDYEAMLRLVGERPIRVTYDRGRMELMSPLWKHGGISYLLGRLIDVATEEWDIPVEAADPVTFKREDLEKGVEPDRCYYFGEHAALVRGKERLEMGTDPPPDLVIEADVTHSSLDRFGIYAALGISEIWRFAEGTLEFLHLCEDGSYHARETSRNLPALSLALIARFLEQARDMDKTAWIRAFRAEVRSLDVQRPAGPEG